MTKNERINYTRISLGICGIAVTNEIADLLNQVNDLVIEKKEKTDLLMVTTLLTANKKKYAEKAPTVKARKYKK
jgi:hypothetical protein